MTNWMTGVCEADGANIHYLRTGGARPPRELQSLNPRVRVKQIQNAGHGVPYDQPERFAAVVRSFLRPVAAS